MNGFEVSVEACGAEAEDDERYDLLCTSPTNYLFTVEDPQDPTESVTDAHACNHLHPFTRAWMRHTHSPALTCVHNYIKQPHTNTKDYSMPKDGTDPYPELCWSGAMSGQSIIAHTHARTALRYPDEFNNPPIVRASTAVLVCCLLGNLFWRRDL